MNACIVKSILRLVCGCLSLGLLAGTTGCTKSLHETQHEEVSGKVFFKGKPLPGGRVTFAAIEGGFASTRPIDENGNYKINAPIGDVLISVDNRMFLPRDAAKKGKGKGSAQTKGPDHHPKRPDSQAAEAEPAKGRRYVPIPERYANCDTSGLTYTVKPGPQSHDIELSDKPVPPPGAAGP
jgi:hypothetical protein